jgi:hypothetical protein
VDAAKAAADLQAHLDAHAAAVATAREQFTPGIASDAFREPPAPQFLANAAHVIEYQSPQPSSDHEWHAESKRWRLSDAAQANAVARAASQRRIGQLVEKQHYLARWTTKYSEMSGNWPDELWNMTARV